MKDIVDELFESDAASALTNRAARHIIQIENNRLDDLTKLAEALGMGSHARAISPAELFQECLKEIALLKGKTNEI